MTQKIDVQLVQDDKGLWDIDLDSDGDLLADTTFNTTLNCSINWKKRASPDEVTNPSLREGWIGDLVADIPGFETGSKKWLLDQARNTEVTVNEMRNFLIDGLNWLIEENLISSLSVNTVFATPELMQAEIEIILISGEVQSYLFDVWKNTGI